MKPGADDLELVGEAVRALGRGLGAPLHPAAAAVRAATGEVVTGLGLGALCAEPAAVGAALARGLRVATVVVVRVDDAGSAKVSTPCRQCCDLLRTHAPAVRVVHVADGLRVRRVAHLP